MALSLKSISTDEKKKLHKMMVLYFLEIDKSKIKNLNTQAPSIDYPFLDLYWIEGGREAYFIVFEENIAGFALINEHTIDKEFDAQKSIAEYFILPRFRRQAIGKKAAHLIFDCYKTRWEIKQDQINTAATLFWRKTIAEYTDGRFKEVIQENDEAIFQLFSNEV